MDGAVSITVNESPNLVRAGETPFVPAGTEISITFIDRYVGFWPYSSGDGLESLIPWAGGEFKGIMVPNQRRSLNTEAIKKAAEESGVKITLHSI